MLTLDQIKNISFHKAKREGYQPEEVDAFIDDVVAAFEAILNERVATKRKIESLERDLAACREREGSVGEALLAAQHQADVILNEAQSHADLILADARQQASAAVDNIKSEVENQRQTARQLQQEVSAFRGRLLKLYREHLTLIDALPSEPVIGVAEEEEPAEAPVAPAASIPAAQPAEPPIAEEKTAAPAAEPVPQPVPEPPAPKTALAVPEDLSSVSPAAEKTDYATPLLFSDDGDYEEAVPRTRYQSLQFGDDYESRTDSARSASGFFHKKK